jgi:hypothetical protein
MRLNQDVDYVAVLIHGTPQILLVAVGPNEDLDPPRFWAFSANWYSDHLPVTGTSQARSVNATRQEGPMAVRRSDLIAGRFSAKWQSGHLPRT